LLAQLPSPDHSSFSLSPFIFIALAIAKNKDLQTTNDFEQWIDRDAGKIELFNLDEEA
jgi:hypothetical protein